MSINKVVLSCLKPYIRRCHMLLIICGIFYGQSVIAQDVSNILIDQANGHVSWMADGMQWYTSVELDPYFGDTIPIISIDIETGNEVLLDEITNDCYYRGTLATPGPEWKPIAQTHAFINLCHIDLPFTGFISDVNGVYTIEEDPNAPGQLIMQVDDPTTPLTTPNETNSGNNGGYGKLLQPDVQVARNSMPDKFPSVEILVEPSFIETFGTPGYIHRIASTIAFSNFIYGQSGMKQTHLISIDILNGTLNHNGGIGAIKHQLENLRRSTAQFGSGDVSVLMVGGDIDATYTWGWGIDANACELQIAVAENENLNTKEIGRSAAFVTDLPSLIQRGWIFAHELGHVIGASKHVNGDPLMDGWFQNIDTLSEYIAGCDAKTQIFQSCSYDSKMKNVTDFYTCE